MTNRVSQSLFHYSDPADLLRDHYRLKKSEDNGFSIRKWSSSLGMKNHSTLSHILLGNKNIPSKYVPVFLDYFQFHGEEKRYFETIIALRNTKRDKNSQREYYESQIEEIRSKISKSISKNIVIDFSPFSAPLSFFILEAVHLSPIYYVESTLKLYQLFSGRFQRFEIKRLVDKLIDMKYLKKNETGILERSYAYLYSAQDQLDPNLQQYHHSLISHAQQSLLEGEVHLREFNGVAMNVSFKRIEEIKKYLRRIIEDYVQSFEEDQNAGNAVAQLNLQWFLVGYTSENVKEFTTAAQNLNLCKKN